VEGADRLQALAERLLASVGADEAELVAIASDASLTRFASNHVHQNVAEADLQLRLRVVRGGRVGVATTNDRRPEALAALARRAETLADHSPPRSDWPGLPRPAPVAPMPAPDEATLKASPAARAERVAALCRPAAGAGAQAAGALSTGLWELAVANSHGVWAYGAQSRAHWVAVVLAGSGAGYSEWTGACLGDLDAAALADEALAKALASREPQALAPGVYPVVLEPYAVALLASFLGHLGFSGQAVVEGRSFLSERAGQLVASPQLSLVDDWARPGQVGWSFDFEGVPRQPVTLLEAGVAREAVWDTESAALAGGAVRSTGHALPAPNTWGPVAQNLVLAPGDAATDDLIATIEHGVYVTRFNYVRSVHPKQTLLTGLTRDGTFLIRDGRRAEPVMNLRFTQRILDAFEDVRAVGQALRPVGDYDCVLAPALALGHFEFTGATTF
jgi:predicted Zn-dependent protease